MSSSLAKLLQMIKHPIRRFLGLTVLYSVIILGIFLLQFRSETAISQTFSGLRLHLVETQSDANQRILKNTFQSTYKGLSLLADEQNPVIITTLDGRQLPVSLLSWQESSPLNFTLFFQQDVAVRFSVNPDDSSDFLSVEAILPENVSDVSIPYKPASGYLVTEQDARRIVISSKTQQYEATAHQITDQRLVMSGREQMATYSILDSPNSFEFSMAIALPLAAETTYLETLSKFKDDFIQLASQSISESATEQLVVAYIAAMAENRQYREALDRIPSSIKTGSRRTYLSAPYFNTLASMNTSLVRHIDNRISMIDYAIQQQGMDIFIVQDLAEILCTMDNREKVEELLSIPASVEEFKPTVSQAAGIINTYTRLSALNKALAAILEPLIPPCSEIISAACTIEDGTIRLEEHEAALPLLDSISVGMSLIAHGQHTGRQDMKSTGYLIINSSITNEVSSSLHVMTELYPIMVPANPYYPHIQIIADSTTSGNGKPIWAWTVAQNAAYVRDAAGNATITLDFPPDEIHHAIINGIRPFTRIDIYGIQFRTDPRFEAYNSSGYTYNAETQTMFLKSLHEVQREEVKLYYGGATEEPEPSPSPTTSAQSSPETTGAGSYSGTVPR